MADKKLETELTLDKKGFSSALRSAGQDIDNFDRKGRGLSSGMSSVFGTIGKVAAVGAAAIGAGFIAASTAIGYFVSEASEAQRVQAQTSATITSTGGAANVTAQHVDQLAGKLRDLSGVDDEVIASGENILLTFTNVRNGIGAGNDIFDQATKAALDMSVALGVDMTDAAMKVGKALNDPILGVTALRRVGVQLNEQQEAQIKAMVAAGDVAGAQKVILQELQKEFGGSAEAAGRTFGGSLEILKSHLGDVSAEIGGDLIPSLTDVVKNVDENIDVVSSLGDVVTGVMPAIGGLISDAFSFLQDTGFIESFGNILSSVLGTAADVLGSLMDGLTPLVPAVMEVGEAFAGIVEAIAPLLDTVISTISGALTPIIEGIGVAVKALQPAFQAVFGALGTIITAISPLLKTVGETIGELVGSLAQALGPAIAAIADAIAAILKPALDIVVPILSKVVQIVGDIVGALGKAIGGVVGFAAKIVEFGSKFSILGLASKLFGENKQAIEEAHKAFNEYNRAMADQARAANALWGEYQKLNEQIKNMAPGSEQHTGAMNRQKEIVDQLIQKYPQLGIYLNEQGVFSQNAAGAIDQLIDKQMGLDVAGGNNIKTLANLVKQQEDAKAKMQQYNAAVSAAEQTFRKFGLSESEASIAATKLAQEGQKGLDGILKYAEGAGLAKGKSDELKAAMEGLLKTNPELATGFGNLNQVYTESGQRIAELRQKIIDTATTAGREGKAIPNEIIQALASGNPQIRKLGAEGLQGYLTELQIKHPAIAGEVQAIMNSGVISNLSSAKPSVRKEAADAFNGYLAEVAAKHPEIAREVNAMKIDAVANAEATDAMRGKGWWAMEGLRGGMDSQKGNVAASAAGNRDSATGQFTWGNWEGWAASKGRGFAEGLSSGIANAAYLVAGAVSNLVTTGINAMKNDPRVRANCPDPWAETLLLGSGFSHGLAIGITDKAKLVKAAISDLLDSMSAGVALGAVGAGGILAMTPPAIPTLAGAPVSNVSNRTSMNVTVNLPNVRTERDAVEIYRALDRVAADSVNLGRVLP